MDRVHYHNFQVSRDTNNRRNIPIFSAQRDNNYYGCFSPNAAHTLAMLFLINF